MSFSASAPSLEKRIAKSSQDQIEQELFQAADKRIAELNKTGVTHGLTGLSEPKCQHLPVLIDMGDFDGWTHEDLADKGGKTWELETDRRLRRINKELTREKIKVNDILKDVVKQDGNTKKCRHVMLIGPAGSGKTTLLKRIAKHASQGKYEMLKDKLLLNADLRSFPVDKKILPSQGLLGSTFSDWKNERMDQRYQWVLNNSEKVGFFVDSLDTLPFDLNSKRPPIAFNEPTTPDVILHNLLAKELFPKSFIVSSSREFKVRNMHPTVRPDRCILLDGLEEESVKDLIDGFLGKDKGAEMKKYIDNECPEIWPLLSIPVFLVFSTISFAQDGFKPKTMSGILIKYFLCLIHSPHALEKDILSVLYKLMPMSFEAIRKGQVLFTLEDLIQFGLTLDLVRDLTSLIPQTHGTGVSLKLMQKDRFFLYFNHQTQQETLSALHVLSLEMKEFNDFVQLELYVETFGVVRRLVFGILLNDEVLEAAKELTEIADIGQKKSILLESLRTKLTQCDKKELLELFIDLNETKEAVGEVIRSTVRDIDLKRISLSPSDIQTVAFVMRHCEQLGKVNLASCNLNARKMEIIDTAVMQSHLKFRKLDVSGNEKLGPEGMHLLGKLVKNHEVEEVGAGGCNLIEENVQKFAEGLGEAKFRKLDVSRNKGLGPEGMSLLGKLVKDHEVKEVSAKDCNPNEENVQKFVEGLGEAKFDSLDLSCKWFDTPVYVRSLLNLLPRVNKEINLQGWQINEIQQRELQDKLNEICSPTLSITLGTRRNPIELKARISEKGANAEAIPDVELRQQEFQYSQLDADKEIGPKGGDVTVDECSLFIPPKSLVDTQNLSVGMSMNFRNLGLPANRVPISPCLKVKFGGKLRIPAKARVPTWFKASKGSQHAIKIYKRNRDGENNLVWRELEIEVKVYDDIIEFEVDHFCWFIALIKEWLWGYGEMKLTHGLFQRKRNFKSLVCYRSPESLFRQNVADLKEEGYKRIHHDSFVMYTNQEVPVRMECFKEHLHEFKPQQYILSPSAIKRFHTVNFPFLLQHLQEPTDEVDIRYIVNGFSAPFAVNLPSAQATSAVGLSVGDGATVNITGGVSVHAGNKGVGE